LNFPLLRPGDSREKKKEKGSVTDEIHSHVTPTPFAHSEATAGVYGIVMQSQGVGAELPAALYELT
jgi:hypothetical protein